MNTRQRIIVLLFSALLPAGCGRAYWADLGLLHPAAGSAIGVYFVNGELEADINASLANVQRAARELIRDREYRTVHVEPPVLPPDERRLEARIPQGDQEKTLRIRLRRKKGGMVHAWIRVGVFGDEKFSRVLLGDLEKDLKKQLARPSPPKKKW